ncbi:MAG: hypothetical protein G4V63_10325 [Candidatus Afipia apatlaquensis]|uniref:Uncharacterized protein n=1 Tax=Candidatus Afipia apatlaquensis TaxID=2712852 RepID=A0A7C9RFM8_9BRAD|nr:hypothetical protein [Candidatus Afipia apatlaquensis]
MRRPRWNVFLPRPGVFSQASEMRSLLLGRFAVGDGTIENRSGRTLEEFQHQVQSVFLCAQISYSDRRTNSTVS